MIASRLRGILRRRERVLPLPDGAPSTGRTSLDVPRLPSARATGSGSTATRSRLRFEAGDGLVTEGERDDSFAILLSGALVVELPHRPRIEAGSVFGELAFLTGEPRSATVRAETPGELLRLNRDAFDVLSARHAELGRSIALELGRIVAVRLQQRDAR